MRIIDLLKPESIDLNAQVTTKKGAIDHLVSLMDKGGHLSDAEAYKKASLPAKKKAARELEKVLPSPIPKMPLSVNRAWHR